VVSSLAQGMTGNDMKRRAEAAARMRAGTGGAEVHEVSFLGEPALVDAGLWLIKVRVMMRDGTAKAYECDATERDVFAVREVPAG
jgi:hypothetical protein